MKNVRQSFEKMEHSDSPPSIRINQTASGVPEEHLLDEIRQVITVFLFIVYN